MTLDCIFVTTGRHPETEQLICAATRGRFAHAATRIDIDGRPMVIEAVRPAVRMAPGDVFDSCAVLEVHSLPISEAQRQAVVSRAFKLVGHAYGVDDCIIGGVHDVLGDKLAGLVDRVLDDHDTLNCSGTQTELVRAAFPDYAQGIDASTITPEQERQMIIRYREACGFE